MKRSEVFKKLQLRALANEKSLEEQRAELLESMESMTNSIEMEKRAFTDEENQQFEETEKKIQSIDNTLEMLQRAKSLKMTKQEDSGNEDDVEAMEVRAFANIIRERADSNITKGDNGAVIPRTIMKRIIDKVKDISPLFKDATRYDIKGTVAVPYVDESNDNLTVAYADEFNELEAKSTKLLTVDLQDFLAGVLAKISISLLNSTDIDLVDFVVAKIATSVALFMDREILVGTNGKITGLSNATQILKSKSATAVTADELIMLKDKLKSVYQAGAYFVMAPETLTAVKLLKDGNQRYLFNDDITQGFSGTILGKPVYTTDQCPALEAGEPAIFYVNAAEGLSTKCIEDSVQILREKYATQHALGIVAWIDADAKIVNQQAVAVLKMNSSVSA
ncbi:MAG: phage major capsid protein [Butyrivibrio sp.]|jgi:HK97 family phage major capsid protein|nr:phage major capsid protein [Butyrivibrio sp.]